MYKYIVIHTCTAVPLKME